MRNQKFYVLNAFALESFSGNPAAVFPDARDIPEEQLLPIAKQLNLIETVYVYPQAEQKKARYRLRYFTPLKELPLAGHPTIAAWSALVKYGGLEVEQEASFFQETQAGFQEIRVYRRSSNDLFILMRQPDPVLSQEVGELAAIAEAIGIETSDILRDLPIKSVNVGLGHLIVPIRSLEATKRARMNIEKLNRVCQSFDAREAQLFCFDTHNRENDIFTRNFSPREGPEDPACGNGNGAIGAYLAQTKFSSDNHFSLKAEQGHTVGRPSLIHIEGERAPGELAHIWIGGDAISMSEGRMLV